MYKTVRNESVRKSQLSYEFYSWGLIFGIGECVSTFLLKRNLPQMFALLMEPCAMIQVSILLQTHRTVVANFVPDKFGLFRRNPWQSLAEPRLKNTGIGL